MRAASIALPCLALLAATACKEEPAPVSDEGETDTGELSCLDTETPGDDIIVDSNEAIAALDIGECVPERLLISGAGITDLTPLSKLREVGVLEIRFNVMLSDLEGVDQIERADRIIITGNSVLPTLPEFTELGQAGRITITTHDSLTDLGSWPALESAGGLEVADNEQLTDLSGFEALVTTAGYVRLSNLALVEDMSGLDQLLAVGGELLIEDNPALATLSPLTVQSVGGDLTVSSNTALSECLAMDFASAIEVGGATIVSNNMDDLCD